MAKKNKDMIIPIIALGGLLLLVSTSFSRPQQDSILSGSGGSGYIETQPTSEESGGYPQGSFYPDYQTYGSSPSISLPDPTDFFMQSSSIPTKKQSITAQTQTGQELQKFFGPYVNVKEYDRKVEASFNVPSKYQVEFKQQAVDVIEKSSGKTPVGYSTPTSIVFLPTKKEATSTTSSSQQLYTPAPQYYTPAPSTTTQTKKETIKTEPVKSIPFSPIGPIRFGPLRIF